MKYINSIMLHCGETANVQIFFSALSAKSINSKIFMIYYQSRNSELKLVGNFTFEYHTNTLRHLKEKS